MCCFKFFVFASALLYLSGINAAVKIDERMDPCQRSFIDPVRVLWSRGNCASYGDGKENLGTSVLLGRRFGQFPEGRMWLGSGLKMISDGTNTPSVLVDFGRELHGGVKIGVGAYTTGQMRIRLRFGESVSEAMSEIKEKNACNVHAMRDMVVEVAPNGGWQEFGTTGFRFVRLDVLSKGEFFLEFIQAVSLMRPMEARGGFCCSDERLNQIFDTAVRTVHLCSQQFIWDGIKRDRCVWMGDLHPEVMALLDVFGGVDVIPETLQYMIDTTPSDKWMNSTISTYTLWWMKCMHDWWFRTGDLTLAERNREYFKAICRKMAAYVRNGEDVVLPKEFLDWGTVSNTPAVHAGSKALMKLAFDDAARLSVALGESENAEMLREKSEILSSYPYKPYGSKSAAAILAMSGVCPAKDMFDQVIGPDLLDGFSTFYGYYVLEAMSMVDEKQAAINVCRDFWGAMLDMGATSFWEHFDVSWTNNAFRIDEMPVPGRNDVHGDFGKGCYKGLRRSLCHGWSAGPAAWLIENVLGVRPIEPGCRKVEVKPFLGDLEWAEGALAVPGGAVQVRVWKDPSGKVFIKISAPPGIDVIEN